MAILVPAKDFVDVADAIREVQRSLGDDGNVYVVVNDDYLELREGTNVTYGGRPFTPARPDGDRS
ncbi:MAG: hypothetical protein PGN37_20470 [Mycobacterium kyogaense]|uniref:hypothetical protein n=1 Tax=Mycobacterium kyogaense TaxID=2212479 RepID=UPI002FF4F4A8